MVSTDNESTMSNTKTISITIPRGITRQGASLTQTIAAADLTAYRFEIEVPTTENLEDIYAALFAAN